MILYYKLKKQIKQRIRMYRNLRDHCIEVATTYFTTYLAKSNQDTNSKYWHMYYVMASYYDHKFNIWVDIYFDHLHRRRE